jgi:hypothetical protein
MVMTKCDDYHDRCGTDQDIAYRDPCPVVRAQGTAGVPESKFSLAHDILALWCYRTQGADRGQTLEQLADRFGIALGSLNYKISAVKRLETGEGATDNGQLRWVWHTHRAYGTELLMQLAMSQRDQSITKDKVLLIRRPMDHAKASGMAAQLGYEYYSHGGSYAVIRSEDMRSTGVPYKDLEG